MDLLIKFIMDDIPWRLIMLVGGISVIFSWVYKLVVFLVCKLHKLFVHYPKTQFGFQGKLIYTDDNPNSKVFVSHAYELAAKPDFIFKIGINQYAAVEYKSRNSSVRQSDIEQLKATAIACRSEYRIVVGYVVTNGQTKKVALGSNRQLYRDIKSKHVMARKIKLHNYFPKKETKSSCQRCGYKDVCDSNTRY